MYYSRYLLIILIIFLSLGIVSAEGVDNTSTGGGELSNDLSSNASIVIDDSNFNSYFDSEGYIINSDIEENSTIYFDNISNKNVVIDIPLTVTAFNSNSIILNTTFRITEDGSGSSIKNLVFNNVAGSEAATPILIDESSNNVISNNVILLDFNEDSYYSIAGLYICGESVNNTVSYNRISINSKNKNSKHYAYGIELSAMLFASTTFSKSSPSSNNILGNMIQVSGDHYSNGIYSSNAFNNAIVNNDILLDSASFAYGIITEFFDTGSDLSADYHITISDNKVTAYSSMIYLVETFRASNVNILSNRLTGIGDAVYGIAAYDSHYLTVYNNDILVNGSDSSKVSENFDAITSGHSGIYFMKGSHDINVCDNRILSYYDLGNDYAIKLDSSCSNISIVDNRMSSNNNSFVGDDSIMGSAYTFNNTAYSLDKVNVVNYTIVDIYVNVNFNGNGSQANPFNSISDALLYLKSLVISNSDVNYKGRIHVANGTYTGLSRNIALTINDLNVEIIGEAYNTTVIKSGSSNFFFDISKDSNVEIKNITFLNGVLRKNDMGLIINKGNLCLENCIFENSRLVASSAVVYNYGILRLSGNKMEVTTPNGHYIYNKGKVDNLVLNFLGDSILEEERTIKVNSPNVMLFAYLHDDMGNPVTGGSVKFMIQNREFVGNFDVNKGFTSFDAILSVSGNLRVNGYYSNALTNTFVNIGYIESSVIMDDAVFYVSNDGDDINGNGSFENPFKTVKHALSLADILIDHFTIQLSEGSFDLTFKDIYIPYGVTVSGVKNKTYIKSDCYINTESVIELNNLIFDKTMINNSYATLTVNNCYFTKAPVSAIYSRDADLTVADSTFADNGVAIYQKSYGGGVVVPHSMEEFNLGGAIHNIGGKLTIISSDFTNNKAVFGGAIYNNQSNLYISGSNFTSNMAHVGINEVITRSFGGAIYQFLGQEVIISDCIFNDNYANGFGGAFYSSGSQPCANDYGYNALYGDWYISNLGYSFQEIYFINCIFNQNIAPLGGGGTYIMDNILTQYIGCNFVNNVVYTYDPSTIESTFIENRIAPELYFSEQMNLGGAMYDKNLLILDSSFESNSFDSGGALILPSTNFREFVMDTYYRPHFENYGDGGQAIYVADSSLLTGDDSLYLGIGGWKGSYDGPSISKFIPEYYENINPYIPSGVNSGGNGDNNDNSGSGSGDTGNGGSESGDGGNGDSGSGDGSGTSGGSGDSGNGNSQINGNQYLSLNDIYNIIGNNNGFVTKDGVFISSSELLNWINQQLENIDNYNDVDDVDDSGEVIPVNNTEENDENPDDDFAAISDFLNELIINQSSVVDNATNVIHNDEIILVNGTDDESADNSEGLVDNNGEAVSVGESSDPLTGNDVSSNPDSESGESTDSSNSMFESENGDNSQGVSNSFSNPPSDSSKAYEVSKDGASKDIDVVDNSMIISVFVVLLFVLLFVVGYYKNKSDDD